MIDLSASYKLILHPLGIPVLVSVSIDGTRAKEGPSHSRREIG